MASDNIDFENNDGYDELESAMDNVTIDDGKFDPNWLKGTSAEKEFGKKESSKSKNKSNDYSHPVYKKISKLNGKINKMSYLELTKCLNEHNLDSSGKKEILVKRLKSYYLQLHLNRVDGDKKDDIRSKDLLDYVCVIDFEATCEDSNEKYPHEIIEFPIVLVNLRTMEIEETFQTYVKPVINPVLSKFCTHLTGITQDKVQNADKFPKVLEKVNDWFLKKELGTKYKFGVASDGPWDFESFLNYQCLRSDVLYPHWARRWIDVRKLFANWFDVRRCGIQKMLRYLGLDFEGQQHCGLDDAHNLARILLKLVADGCMIKLNERIRNCQTRIEENKDEKVDDSMSYEDN